VESDLSSALATVLSDDQQAVLRGNDGDPVGREALERVEASALRVQLARQFHNDAVAQVRRVRAKTVVRVFRLAGHAALPDLVDFDDRLPGAGA
jgi:hypothetical protein